MDTRIKVAILCLLLYGCSGSGKDFLKQIEGKSYDAAADKISAYCKNLDSPLAQQERLEARREMRQRGTDGPVETGPAVQGLDEKTQYGSGPVIRVWCKGDDVPAGVWEDFVR